MNPRSSKVPSMTTRSRKLALSFAALMVASSLVSLVPPATAQDTVPTNPAVTFSVVPHVEHRLYLRFPGLLPGEDEQAEPDCLAADGRFLGLTPAPAASQDLGGRTSCPFNSGEVARFVSHPSIRPVRAITLTGNVTSVVYHHMGDIPADTTVEITLKSGDTTVATGTLTAANAGAAPLTLFGTTGRATLAKDQNVVIELRATAATAGGLLPVAAWTLNDANSYLSLQPDDSVRAATWVTDERSTLRTIFSPIANDSQRPEDLDRRIVGHFALQSSFGYEDASRGDPARFRLFFNGTPREVGPDGATVLVGELNQSASAPANGTAVWSFPANTLKYVGSPSGEYTLRVDKRHHQSAGITAGIEKAFAITAQGIDLRAFADARTGVSESLTHTVQAGSSTTYLLQVNNTGAVNDTFSINVTAPNAPAGWGATIGGPDVQARRVFVPKGETRVFTLTVNAPTGATGQIIHLVNVTSAVDPGVRSRDLTIVSTVGAEVVREVGVVFLARNLEVEPSVETHFPVYVWNRGTRPANISLELRETSVATWTADLAFGATNADRIPLGGIQPGDVAEATLKITGTSAGSPTHTVTLNVTHQDVPGVSAERAVTFALRITAGVSIRVLDTIGGQGHVAELGYAPPAGDGAVAVPSTECTAASGTLGEDCDQDGVEGLWYRIWVTNTGRATERFELTSELFRVSCSQPGDATAFFDHRGAPPSALGFYFRSPAGVPSSGATSMELGPRDTGEVYFLMPVNRGAHACNGNEPTESMDFVVQARGITSGAIARQQLRATATNAGGSEAVYIEPVARLDYSANKPLVDAANATKRSVTGGIRPGGEIYYYVRVTNAASWRNFTDADGDLQTSDLHLALEGVNFDEGWNVSMRFVEGDLNGEQMRLDRNPFKRELNLTNLEPGTDLPRAWVDKEVQVRVQAPSVANGTAVTNAQDTVFLVAQMNSSAAKNTLELVTLVTDFAQVNLRTDVPRVYAHAGDTSAFPLYLNNTGGSETTVTMRATMQQPAQSWQIEPNSQTFTLGAFKNRTIALRVVPPANAPTGTTATVNITVEYVEFPKLGTNVTRNATLPVTVEVVGPGTLQLDAATTQATVAPPGFANFTMTLRNTGSLNVPYRIVASDIPNWTVTPSIEAPEYGNLSGGATRPVTLVARVPHDATNGSSFSTIVRVEDVSSAAAGTQNFDTIAFTVNILGGRAIPSISVPNVVKRVDRGGFQDFEVGIRNVGSTGDRLPLEWRALDPTWSVVVRNAQNQTINSVFLAPNEQVNVLVNVSAPFVVPERAVVPIEIAAYTPDLTQRATATLSAEIHDYGVQLVLTPSSRDGMPGLTSEFVARVRNTGNDNDTLNLSVNLVDLPGWSVQHVEEVRLEPNQETDIRLTIRSPDDPLPPPRAYTFPVWVGTRGGQAVNLSKNMTQSAVVTIPNYRAYDMDDDGQLEVAVDEDKRTSNGFEEFREIFVAGSDTRAIGEPIFDGRTTFLLDVPTAEESHDGVADIWFNPETVHAFTIEHAPDVNGDGTPDYLLDTDRNGKIDRAYDSVSERFWTVVEVKIFGDERIQYLVDVTGDGRPDRFYDPEADRVTRTQAGGDLGAEYIGIDVDNDQQVDYYYNTRTEETSGAEVQNISGFAQRYWYFFVLFAALVVVSIALLVRRRTK